MMYERPLRLKYSLERLALAELPTQRTEAIVLPKVAAKLLPITEPLLPLDELGRPYLISFVKWTRGLIWDDTLYHTERLVKEYRELSKGRYPTEIVLRAERYYVGRCKRFYPWGDISIPPFHYPLPIPFRYEDASANYEILVRGEV